MKSITTYLLLLVAIATLSFAPAGTYKIGDAVADFSLKNVDGKMLGLSQYPKAKGCIIVFTCNHCPFAKQYQTRLNALNKKYAGQGFPLLAISANDPEAVPEDTYENMVIRAKEKKYNFPYLYDETQAVARAFDAKKTPHAFVVAKENNKWILKYAGAIDDNCAEPEKAQRHYVIDAVEALLAGKQVPVAETKSIGCGIKWRNK